jgi:phosphoglycolate phosphatase-like HAD superfamily hydrolase
MVVGIDYQSLNQNGKPFESKAEAIRFTLAQQNDLPQESIYIGDTPSDRESCHIAGVPFVAVTYGFHQWSIKELLSTESAGSFIDAISTVCPRIKQA